VTLRRQAVRFSVKCLPRLVWKQRASEFMSSLVHSRDPVLPRSLERVLLHQKVRRSPISRSSRIGRLCSGEALYSPAHGCSLQHSQGHECRHQVFQLRRRFRKPTTLSVRKSFASTRANFNWHSSDHAPERLDNYDSATRPFVFKLHPPPMRRVGVDKVVRHCKM